MDFKELLEAINNKILAKDERMKVIDSETKDLNEEELSKREAEIETLTSEKDALIKEREELIAKHDEELRREAEEAEMKNKNHERGNKTMELNRRSALSLFLGAKARNRDLNEEEKRAVGNALTTTATTHVTASSTVDGVNNLGVTIATKVLLDLLKEEGKITGIFNDINFAYVKGMTSFPYRKARSTAKNKTEGQGVAKADWEWATLEASKGFIMTDIPVTQEVMNLSEVEVGEYILNTLLQDMVEDWSEALIYGTGSNAVKGVSIGASVGSFAKATIADDLAKALSSLPLRYRNGAKVYVAQDVYDTLLLAKDGGGHYLFAPYGAVVAPKILGAEVVLDQTLKAHDILIGNVGSYFKGNILADITIEFSKDIKTQITDYVGSVNACSAPVPTAFVFGAMA